MPFFSRLKVSKVFLLFFALSISHQCIKSFQSHDQIL
jgi:hypothetical protein